MAPGVVHRVNKLVSVLPVKARYGGQIGDVVVGRIIDVGQKRWRVDINATQVFRGTLKCHSDPFTIRSSAVQDAVLMLASVNLPGDVQRRRLIHKHLTPACSKKTAFTAQPMTGRIDLSGIRSADFIS